MSTPLDMCQVRSRAQSKQLYYKGNIEMLWQNKKFGSIQTCFIPPNNDYMYVQGHIKSNMKHCCLVPTSYAKSNCKRNRKIKIQ